MTPTQKKQVWHVPKKNKLDVSPKKAENLSYEIAEYNVCKKKKRSVCYDPRPQSFISQGKEWATTVRNKVINYCSLSQKRIGLCGILDSANMQDVIHDHDYLPFPLHHQLILNKISVTPDSAKEIEKKTKNQTKTKLWHTERSFRVTASRVGEICKFTAKKDQEKYAQSLICNKKIVSTALEWGKSMETTAIEAYEGKTGKKVERCGLYVSVQYPFIGASPDGLIGDNKILEVKCPYSIKDEMIGSNNYFHLEHDLQLKETSNYYYQIQTQLLVTGRDCCDLFIWTNVDEKIINVKKK
ncbi:unnamed protein product [Parnassius apollo]|uniref:(apollo) hypothetical protein n=1 Tax=Parnassius apollo TaxID=110799 RepID=A0A8S3XYC8_PARAO|nr:unnamed protein product [Parnassius apollo]